MYKVEYSAKSRLKGNCVMMRTSLSGTMPKHFEDKDALSHVMEKRVEGMVSISEVHGTEMAGHFSALIDAMRESAVALLLFWLFLHFLNVSSLAALIAFGVGWIAWKGGRSGWLGWAKLERLHRLIEQERYEIEHHRPQEREELEALYRAKGFEGKLLQDVVDVLMSDQDRLLKVMLEEEMGLTLQAYEHPLQQTAGALIGASLSVIMSCLLFFFFPLYGVGAAAFLLLFFSAAASAYLEKNKAIHAVIWNLSICALAFGAAFFIYKIIA